MGFGIDAPDEDRIVLMLIWSRPTSSTVYTPSCRSVGKASPSGRGSGVGVGVGVGAGFGVAVGVGVGVGVGTGSS